MEFETPDLDIVFSEVHCSPSSLSLKKWFSCFQPVMRSYLRVEAYLTDVAGDNWPLCFNQRWAEGVRHDSLLDRVHLGRDNPEVTWKIQQRRGISASSTCRQHKSRLSECGKEEKSENEWQGKPPTAGLMWAPWLMWTGRCVFSQQQLALPSVMEYLGAVQTL